MLNAISTIINTIVSLIVFLSHVITSLISFIANLPTYLNFMITSVDLLPGTIIPFASAALLITYVLFVINR